MAPVGCRLRLVTYKRQIGGPNKAAHERGASELDLLSARREIMEKKEIIIDRIKMNRWTISSAQLDAQGIRRR